MDEGRGSSEMVLTGQCSGASAGTFEGNNVDVEPAEGCSRGEGGGRALGVTIISLYTTYMHEERVLLYV